MLVIERVILKLESAVEVQRVNSGEDQGIFVALVDLVFL